MIVGVSEAVYRASKGLDELAPIHLEVLLPAFVLGCVLARPAGADPHSDDAREGHHLALTGLFILAVKGLLRSSTAAMAAAAPLAGVPRR